MAAYKALSNLLEPLAGFVLDSGISTHELESMFRVATVRSVATRQLEISRRASISGIAASTGIPRAEISRILRMSERQTHGMPDRQQQATNRILAAWHEDPRFTTENGQPADLQIFGPGATFDFLVKKYGRGIPTRATLDELARTNSIEILGQRKVRVKALVAVDRGISPRAVKAFGDRATELLATMLANMRSPDRNLFISYIEGNLASRNSLPIIRREVSGKGADFLDGMRDVLSRSEPVGRENGKTQASQRVSVTIFYHEKSGAKIARSASPGGRRNLRRKT
jgi:hypothetical protein